MKLREMKKEQKDIKEMYKDALAQADEYDKISEDIKVLKEKKKQIETRIQAEMGKSWEKLEDLKSEEQAYKEMITDIAMSTLMKGETVEVKDEYENPYEPVFSVKFKKNNEGATAGE